MSDIKISEMPAADAANLTDQVELNQSGTTRRGTLDQLKTIIGGATGDFLPLTGGTLTGQLSVMTGAQITDFGVFPLGASRSKTLGSPFQAWSSLSIVSALYMGATSGWTVLQAPAVAGGTVTLPPGTGTLATQEWAQAQGYALLASPAFTGTPTVPTQSLADYGTTAVNSKWVKDQGYGAGGGGISEAPNDGQGYLRKNLGWAAQSETGLYLPLTGGTLTGALTGTLASFTTSLTTPLVNATASGTLGLNAPTGGIIEHRINGVAIVSMNNTALYPPTDNAIASGGVATRWSVVRSVDLRSVTATLTGALTGTTGAFSGDVTFTTQATGDSTTKAATTAFVQLATSMIPQNSKSAAYTLVLGDAGKHIYHPSADTTARSFTIPGNATVAYPIGTALTFVNDTSAGVVTIIPTDPMILAGAGTTGNRTLAANGIATALKLTATRWIISGTGLT